MGKHLIYLDEGRTHEVHAQLEPRPTDILLSTMEFPAGSRDPIEALVEERALPNELEVQHALLELEQRLALSGKYYRADAADMRWSPLSAPPAARRIDLRAHEVALPGNDASAAKVNVHHFHSSGRDSLLISVPRADLQNTRSVLAQLDFDFPRVADGDLKVLHSRLAPSTLKSAVVKQHFELPTRGYAKLIEARDYEMAYGPSWLERTRDVLRTATSRVFDLGRRHEPPAPRAPDHARQAPRSIQDALASPKVQELRARFLRPGEAASLFHGGELAIRRFIALKRKRMDHHIAYDISVLESTLLVEYGLLKGEQTLLDEEGAKVLRYAAAMPRARS